MCLSVVSEINKALLVLWILAVDGLAAQEIKADHVAFVIVFGHHIHMNFVGAKFCCAVT